MTECLAGQGAKMREFDQEAREYFLAGCNVAVSEVENDIRVSGYADVALHSLAQRFKDYSEMPFYEDSRNYRNCVLAGYFSMVSAFGEGIDRVKYPDLALLEMKRKRQQYREELLVVPQSLPSSTGQ